MAPGAISLSVAAENEHTHSPFEASTSEAWFRHSPRNGKPLFSMNLALPEIGCKEAQGYTWAAIGHYDWKDVQKTKLPMPPGPLTFVSQVWAFQFKVKTYWYGAFAASSSSCFSFSGASSRLAMLQTTH